MRSRLGGQYTALKAVAFNFKITMSNNNIWLWIVYFYPPPPTHTHTHIHTHTWYRHWYQQHSCQNVNSYHEQFVTFPRSLPPVRCPRSCPACPFVSLPVCGQTPGPAAFTALLYRSSESLAASFFFCLPTEHTNWPGLGTMAVVLIN